MHWVKKHQRGQEKDKEIENFDLGILSPGDESLMNMTFSQHWRLKDKEAQKGDKCANKMKNNLAKKMPIPYSCQ